MIDDDRNISDSHSFLRIREECDIASLIFRRPAVITETLKY